MAFLIKDRVLETCSSPGTGAATLLGAVTGYQSFSTAFSSTNGTTTYYCIADQGGANWEVGLGTWNTGNTLTRTTVIASSNAGATVNFASGTQNIFCTYPAEYALYSGGPLGTPSSGTATNLTGLPISTGVSGLGTGVATALAVNVGSAGAPVVNGGALGTPSSGTMTNVTGLPLSTGVTGTLPVANGGTGVTTSTGSGNNVLSTSPTLVTPILGTPTSVTLTNATGLPLSTGVTGTLGTTNGGTGATSAGIGAFNNITGYTASGATGTTSTNLVFSTSPTLTTPILGTPTSVTLTNATGLPLSTGVTGTLLEANGGTGTTTGYYGFKNRIINGAMVIDQRNAGASVSVGSGDTTFDVDRWMGSSSQASKFTLQQSTTAPAGFKNSMVAAVTSTISVGAGDYAGVLQRVEGLNTYDFGWGAAGASAVTVSFWVRSSITGTYCVSIRNSGDSRSYVSTYTVNSANTWEQKSITISGDVAGTWLTTNGIGLVAYFTLSCGSTYGSATANTWSGSLGIATSAQTQWIQNSGATFYITGVQLEKGSTATSFDYRPYGTELALCQRYYWKNGGATSYLPSFFGVCTSTTNVSVPIQYPVTMRASPTFSTGGGSGSMFTGSFSALAADTFGIDNGLISVQGSGFTTAAINRYQGNSAGGTFVALSAEL